MLLLWMALEGRTRPGRGSLSEVWQSVLGMDQQGCLSARWRQEAKEEEVIDKTISDKVDCVLKVLMANRPGDAIEYLTAIKEQSAEMEKELERAKQQQCSWATGPHDDSCDIVKGLERQRDAARSELSRINERVDDLEQKQMIANGVYGPIDDD